MREALQKFPVEHRRVFSGGPENGLGHPPHECHVAADPHLHVRRGRAVCSPRPQQQAAGDKHCGKPPSDHPFPERDVRVDFPQ